MSQAHLFGTHDGIFSTFVYVQRQECHYHLGDWLYFISNKRPLSEIYGGRLLERGVSRIFLGLYWAFIAEGRLLEKIR